jgi:prefoldin subunit 5
VPVERDELSRLIAKLEYHTDQAEMLNSELADTLQNIVSLTAKIAAMKAGNTDVSN